MNSDPRSAKISAGGAEDCLRISRDTLDEFLGFVRVHAEMAQMHLSAADDVGALYSMKRLLAYVKVAAATANDINKFRAEIGAGQ